MSFSRSNLFAILICLFVICLSFIIKFSYLQERRTFPDFTYPTMDSKYHDDWAWGLASGEWEARIGEVKAQPYFRAPLYPYFVSAVYRVFGHDYLALRLVQIILGSASVLLFFLLTRALFGTASGWIALILYLGYWPITYFEAELLIPSVAIFLDLMFILSLIWAGRKNIPYFWLLPGLLLGVSAIARPNILIVIIPVLVWIYKRSLSNSEYRARRVIWVFMIGIMIPILPVTIRNAVIGNDFVMISSQGGVNFYIGNNPASDGVKAVVPGTKADWWGGYYDTQRIAKEAAGRDLRPSQVSRYWFVEGAEFFFQQPVSALKLYLKKLALFFGNGEVSNNRQLYFIRSKSYVLRILFVNFALILAFSLIGIISCRSAVLTEKSDMQPAIRLERLLPLYFIIPYSLSILLFFITSRYRLPVSIMLMTYSAFGMRVLYERIRSRKWAQVLPSSLAVLFIFAISGANPFGVGNKAFARGYYDLGLDYTHTNCIKAVECFTQATQLDSTYAPAWKMRGWSYNKIGLYDCAMRDLEIACAIDSSSSFSYLWLGIVCQKCGKPEKAARAYERVTELDQDNKVALTNMADICLRKGDYDRAHRLLRRALRVDPGFVNAIFGIACYYEKTGQLEAAIREFGRISHTSVARMKMIHICVASRQLEKANELISEFEQRFPGEQDVTAMKNLIRQQSETAEN